VRSCKFDVGFFSKVNDLAYLRQTLVVDTEKGDAATENVEPPSDKCEKHGTEVADL
jgi:hypothetical protein